jgi:hypothetical protein
LGGIVEEEKEGGEEMLLATRGDMGKSPHLPLLFSLGA